jgi:hypothetical protein
LNERTLVGVQFGSGYARDECAWLHRARLALRHRFGQQSSTDVSANSFG